jgi:F-type H+-transporting ATPase subunit epsilon
MAKVVRCEIVSAEEELFIGEVEMLIAAGTLGDLGIAPNHAPLLTQLVPGPVRLIMKGGQEELFYVSGGMLEVQPHCIIILADSALRAGDMDEAAAKEAQQEAARLLSEKGSGIDYSAVASQLAEAAAQLRTIRKIRKQLGR